MVCNACVFSIARIEHNDFDSLHSVAAIPSLAVDIDDNNPACTVHPSHLSSTMYRLSTLLPPPPSSSYTLSRRSRIHLPLPPRRHHINEPPRIRNSLLRTTLWRFLLLLRLNLRGLRLDLPSTSERAVDFSHD